MKKISFLFLVMLALSYGGQKISSYIYQFQGDSFQSVITLLHNHIPFIIFVNVLIYCLEMVRLRLIGMAFDLKIRWKDCLGAVALNILFAWITPGAILGAPALAYFLYRKSYPLAESITIAFIRSFSIIFVSALTTIVIHSLHLQELVVNPELLEKIFYVLTFLAIYIASLVGISYLPTKFRDKFTLVKNVTKQIRTFISQGKMLIVPVLFCGLLINFLLVSFIPYITQKYYGELTPLISQTLLFLSYILLMPTPGASGLAEVGAPAFFSRDIPLQEIISVVTAMRISTIGLQVTLGAVFMVFIFRKNISLSELLEFKKSKMKTSEADSHEQ